MVDNTSGQDEEIVKEGGEETTDEFSNIVLIKRQQYDALSEEEKQNWVRYNPSLQSQAYAQWLTTQNQMIELYNQIGPLMSKIMPFTGGTTSLKGIPLADLIEAMKPITELAKTMESIVGTISNTPVVNIVAEPLKCLFGLIGSLGAMVFSLFMNPWQMAEAYVATFEKIDWDSMVEHFNAETTPNLKLTTEKVKEIPIPDPEIEKKVEEAVENVDLMLPVTETMINAGEAFKVTMESFEGLPPKLQAISTMGCSWAFQDMLDEFVINFKADQMEAVDPQAQSDKWANNVNGLINSLPEKYIKVSDLEKLKEIESKSVES